MNPFSSERMRELTQILLSVDEDPSVKALVLFGGAGRSFCAGGDFNETSTFSGGEEVEKWIDDIAALYTILSRISKPIIAAIDGHAIGVGLQMALCCDLRIGTRSASLAMPEFRVGIACNFGGYMLEAVVGRSVMQNMLYSCETWDADRALSDGLLHNVVDGDMLLEVAVAHADRLAGYTPEAIRNTRPHVNAAYIDGLAQIAGQAKKSHRVAFAIGAAQQNMRRVVGYDQ